MRKGGDPTYQIDWASWAMIDRNSAQAQAVGDKRKASPSDEQGEDLEPVIAGPWMHRWDIVHHNQHTALLEKEGTEWHKA